MAGSVVAEIGGQQRAIGGHVAGDLLGDLTIVKSLGAVMGDACQGARRRDW